MLYKINPIYTNNNFSTKKNEKLSSNDQYYAAQLYMNFIDKDYEHCEKNIYCEDENYLEKLQCYNTQYKYCIIFVRDNESCKIYNNSKAEYSYYLWVKNKTTIFPCNNIKKSLYHTLGIRIISQFFTAATVENIQRF
jgi:hypothetical protein